MLRWLADLMTFRRPAPGPNMAPAPAHSPVWGGTPPKDVQKTAVTGKKAVPAAIVAMIAGVIAVEGGYVNHPADPGGETNMGITKNVARKNGYTGPMRTLPREVAEDIYYKQYIVAPGFEPLVEVNAPVVEELFDTGVNMGPAVPSRWLQQGINELCPGSVVPDGRVGRATVAGFVACQNRIGASQMCVQMLDRLDAKQKARYYAIVRAKPSSKVFLKGWLAHRIGNVDRRKCRGGVR